MTGLRVKRIAAGELRGATVVGQIIRDGRPGVDDYPWTWSICASPYGSGPSATKQAALDRLTEKLKGLTSQT